MFSSARVAVFFVMRVLPVPLLGRVTDVHGILCVCRLRTYLQRLPFDQSEDEGPALVIAEKDENQPLESEGNGGDQKVSN